MPKQSLAIVQMPTGVRLAMRELGENLAIARKRRKQSQKAWAERLGVSEPTLARMEQGDPSVAMGIYATALWLIGRSSALPDLAAPVHDLGALEDEVRAARGRAVRRPVSLADRLSAAPVPADAVEPARVIASPRQARGRAGGAR